MFTKTFAIIPLLALITSVQAAEIHEIEDSIKKHRTGIIVVQTTPNTPVHVQQLRHEFWFGAAISDGIFNGRASAADVQMYKEKFLENFNSAVSENALKWGNMERERGKVNFATTDNMLTWTDENNIPLRGHNIYWGIPKRVQGWLKTMDDHALHAELRTRARTIAARYQGRFAEYDLNNEMIHGNYYEDRLGPDITGQMVDWIKAIDPQATLYMNDYDVLTGHRLKSYVQHIQNLLDSKVRIDGIGVQGHLHGSHFNPDSLTSALDVLAQFKLPIRISEFNMPGQRSRFLPQGSGNTPEMTPEEEMQRAQQLTDYYRICFAHPAVEGILMWGFWEGANWIPASSLYKKDWTPTPAADAYRSLVFDEWWTDVKATSDERGICTIRAFYGTHRVMANGSEKTIELGKKDGSTYVEIYAKT
ncbi:MAG: glycoside hydrolase [Saprospiraceae bacterium]|nr:glycoside hydrolase [Saprospiraceae bacterium]